MQKDSVYIEHLAQAIRRIKRIESERTLLNGHFSKVAKEYGVSPKDLRTVYESNKAIISKLTNNTTRSN